MVFNHKCMTLSYGIATGEQVNKIINDLILQAEKILGAKLEYDIFLHTKLGGKTYGNGYLWVNDNDFYSLLNKSKSKSLEIGSYKLTHEQKNLLKTFYPRDIPSYGTVIIDKAKYDIQDVDKDIYYINTISVSGVPSWTSTIDMGIMKMFSSSDMYPIIEIDNSKLTITYDPYTNDAIFALLMNQGRTFTNGNRTVNLFFTRELTRYGLSVLNECGTLAKKIIEERLVKSYTGDNYLQYESSRII